MQTYQSIKEKSNDHQTAKKKSLFSGTIIAILVIVTPYLFYQYAAFPDQAIWETSYFVYTSGYYESVQTLAWVLFQKLIPLLLLFLWFFTCKHWWYHVILIPICMYIFQIYSVLNDDIAFADSNEFFVLAPIIFIMLIFSYTVRTRVFDKIHGIDLSELSRVNWKGEIKTDEETIKDHVDNDDDEALFMG